MDTSIKYNEKTQKCHKKSINNGLILRNSQSKAQVEYSDLEYFLSRNKHL